MLIHFYFIVGILEESPNDQKLRIAREREIIGRELVTSAANGDVQNVRLILEKEKLIKASQEVPQNSRLVFTQRKLPELTQNNMRPPTDEEMRLINFVSSGHTSLQAAAQNGHVDVCQVLIGEFGADVEFQVQKYFIINRIFFLKVYCLLKLFAGQRW